MIQAVISDVGGPLDTEDAYAESIAQAYFKPEAWFSAIYSGDNLVGFVMLCDDPAAETYMVRRLMIADAYQGHGHGSEALQLVIDHVRSRPDARELVLSHEEGEDNPGPFYTHHGSECTGTRSTAGEPVMRLKLGT